MITRIRLWWHRGCVIEGERWLAGLSADYRRNGLDDSVYLRRCRAQLEAHRVQVALLESELRRSMWAFTV